MKFFPKEIDFFEIFDRSSLNIMKATELLVALMEKFDNLEERAKEMYEVEQEGDILTHEIMKKLNKTFITPIDREDLHALAASLDDVLSSPASASAPASVHARSLRPRGCFAPIL